MNVRTKTGVSVPLALVAGAAMLLTTGCAPEATPDTRAVSSPEVTTVLASSTAAGAVSDAEARVLDPLTLEQVQADPANVLLPSPAVAKSASGAAPVQGLEAAMAAEAVGVPASGEYVICRYASTVVNDYDWTNKNPSTCGGAVLVYNDGVKVSDTRSGQDEAFWAAIAAGYQAVQTWCDNNGIVCGIITAAGTAILFKRLKI